MRRRVDALEQIRGRQRDRAHGKLGCSLSRAARGRVRGRGVQRRRDLFIGAGSRDREMPGSLLQVDIQLGEASVKPAPSVQRHCVIASRCEQRMSEANPLAVELDHPRVARRARCRRRCCLPAPRAAPPTATRAPPPPRASRARERAGRPTAGRRSLAGFRAARHRRPPRGWSPRRTRAPPRARRTDSPGDSVGTHNRRPRQRDSQPAPEQTVHRSDRQRLDREPSEPSEGAIELERRRDRLPTHRGQGSHRVAVQASQHECEHLRRAGVQPLGVVDRDDDGVILGEHSHRREQRDSEHARVGQHSVRLPEQQRGLERTALHRRQLLQHAVQHRGKQIAECRERDLRLRLRRA